uniref:Uncharacterized protein n=1 Tax=Arundo donax TaxID=35708 RepID=A0A0A9FJW2_ARUDO
MTLSTSESTLISEERGKGKYELQIHKTNKQKSRIVLVHESTEAKSLLQTIQNQGEVPFRLRRTTCSHESPPPHKYC